MTRAAQHQDDAVWRDSQLVLAVAGGSFWVKRTSSGKDEQPAGGAKRASWSTVWATQVSWTGQPRLTTGL